MALYKLAMSAYKTVKRSSSGAPQQGQEQAAGTGFLHPGQRDVFQVVLRAGHAYVVQVEPVEFGVDLDVYVLDERDNVVAADNGPASGARCLVQPAWTGPFSIVVTSSRGSSAYALTVA